ncbi:MAG TPA: ComEC/Rec2 family competence protein [Candidatus Deferrimicrobiaceae bacterium]|nr:ComEC/Rec2 family competence protein [Candidatus Deferrimicrobiaceae bacterium]
MDHPFRHLGPVLLLPLPLLLGFFLGLSAGPCLAVVAGGILFVSLSLVVSRRFPVGAAFAVAALCGVLAVGRLPRLDPEHVRPFLGAEVLLRGAVLQVRHTDEGWSAIAERAEVSFLDGSGSVRPDRVLLSVRNPDPSVTFPAEVRATGRLRAITSRGNPGEIPREWTALAFRVQYRFSTDGTKAMFFPMDDGDGGIGGVLRRSRARASRWIALSAGHSDGALFLRAVATGENPPPSHPMVVLLRRTGLSHLLAISGLHVVLFFSVQMGWVRSVIWFVRRRHGAPDLNRVSSFLALPACWGYAIMAGSPVSAIRAAGMVTVVVLLRHLLGVRGSGAAWTALLLSTIAWSPSSIFSPSFLLSYGASFFLIAAFAGKGEAVFPPSHPFGKVGVWMKNAVIASVMAFLGTLPVSAAFFERLPAGAILWNVLFAPLLGGVGVVGALLGAVGGVFSMGPLQVPVRIAARAIGGLLAVLARVSGGGAWCFPLPPSGILAPVVCTGAAAFGSIWFRRRGREPWPAVVFSGAAFLGWIHLPYAALPDPRLSVAALNVGKGAAHVISFPGGGHMLIDCGSGLRGDAGGSVILPYLRSRGIRRIDALVLTHPHEDHYGGAEAVLSSMPVGEIWIPQGIPAAAFGRAVRTSSDKVRWKSEGDGYKAGGAEVTVRGTGNSGPPRSVNERSLLLEIRYGSFSVWLPGDVERGPSAWGKAPFDKEPGKRVLFLPHHGSAGAKPGSWMQAAAPDVVVSQNSDCFKIGNLVPSVESFFLENGAVTMWSDGKSVNIEQERRHSLWRLFLRLPPEE